MPIIQKILIQHEPKKENLLPVIKEINKQLGCFDAQAAEKVARYFGLAPAAVFSAASFYDETKEKKKIPLHIQICDSTNCLTKGADVIIQEIEGVTGTKVGDQNNRHVRIERTSCNGNCLVGPVVVINGTIFERVVPGKISEILRGYLE